MPNIIHGGGGGSDLKLNVFAQPDLPTDKFDGVLLQTTAKETLKKVVFDTNVWAAGQWQNPSLFADLTYSVSEYVSVYNGLLYHLGSTSWKYNPTTGVTTQLMSVPIIQSGRTVAQILVGDKIYCSDNGITNHSYIYDIATDTFTATTSFNIPLYSGFAVDGGTFYTFGSYYQHENSNGDLSYATSGGGYKYSISTQSGASLASYPSSTLNSGGCYICAVKYEGYIYLFGGQSYSGYRGWITINACYKYSISANTYTAIATLPFSGACSGILIGDKILIISSSGQCYWYDPSADTFVATTSAPAAICPYYTSNMIGDKVFGFNGKKVQAYMLTAKQYNDSTSVILYRLSKDFTHEASIIKGKLIDNLPTNFKDCMLFKDGEITFPALYIGDGAQWNLARAAQ